MRGLTAAIAAGVTVSLAGAAVLIGWHEPATKALGAEAYKILLQFLLVAVLGGGVSLLYQAFNREADRRAERVRRAEERADAVRETRQRYLRELVEHHNIVKRARRLLRATALTPEPEFLDRKVRVSAYDELLRTVVDAQLTMETMVRTMRAEGGLFTGEDDLVASLGRAEEYLRALIAEYEHVLPQGGEPALRGMPGLADFIGPYEQADLFRHEYIHPLEAALAALQRLITGSSAREP